MLYKKYKRLDIEFVVAWLDHSERLALAFFPSDADSKVLHQIGAQWKDSNNSTSLSQDRNMYSDTCAIKSTTNHIVTTVRKIVSWRFLPKNRSLEQNISLHQHTRGTRAYSWMQTDYSRQYPLQGRLPRCSDSVRPQVLLVADDLEGEILPTAAIQLCFLQFIMINNFWTIQSQSITTEVSLDEPSSTVGAFWS